MEGVKTSTVMLKYRACGYVINEKKLLIVSNERKGQHG